MTPPTLVHAAPMLLAVDIFSEEGIHNLVSALLYSVLGVLIFAVVGFFIVKLTPFSIRKEIEDDQNTALGIILGAVIIGISMIISAALQG